MSKRNLLLSLCTSISVLLSGTPVWTAEAPVSETSYEFQLFTENTSIEEMPFQEIQNSQEFPEISPVAENTPLPLEESFSFIEASPDEETLLSDTASEPSSVNKDFAENDSLDTGLILPISRAAINQIAPGQALTIHTDAVTIQFDADAVNNLRNILSDEILFSLKPVSRETAVNPEQNTIIQQFLDTDGKVFDLTLTDSQNNFLEFSDKNKGTISITVPYSTPDGQSPGVFRITEHGEPEDVPSSYDGEVQQLTFTTTHLSLFAIGKTEAVSEKIWIDEIEPQYYTAHPIIPKISVYNHSVLLKEGMDYSLDLSNNVSVGFALVNIKMNGSYSGEYQTTFQILPLQTPQVRALENTTTGVRITWNSVDGAEKYRVFRKTGAGSWKKIGDTTESSLLDPTAKSGTTYTYSLRCINLDATAYTSSYNNTGMSITFLAAPALTKLSNTTEGVSLSWNSVTGAEKYRVFRKNSNGGWTKLKDTTALSYQDKSVQSGGKYTYGIRCISSDGKTYTSSYDAKGKTITYLAAPANPSLKLLAAGVQITWKQIPGAVHYRVFRKKGNGGWSTLGDTTSTSYTDSSAQSGNRYTYAIRCINPTGSAYTSSYHPEGSSISYIAAPDLPVLQLTAEGIQLTWNIVPGAEKYRVFRKTAGESWKKIGDTTVSSYTDTTPKSGTTYTYAIRCMDSGATSYTSSYYASGKTTLYLSTPTISLTRTKTSITADWKAVPGAAKYRIYRKAEAGSWTTLGETTALTYTDITPEDGIPYYYAVRALSGKYISAYHITEKITLETTFENKVQQIMNKMTLAEKITQMFLVTAPAGSEALSAQENYQFGGYLFFGTDFSSRTPAQAKARIDQLQRASKIPMLMTVDEEGGTVTRVSCFSQYRNTPFQSPRAVYNLGGWTGIVNDTIEKSNLLQSIGLNGNLAPLADTAYSSSDFIYQRSFSTDASSVSKFITKTVETMQSTNLVSCLKHFPGYGNNGDTHYDVIHDYRPMTTFTSRDLLPFQAGIDAGCDMIMVSHNIVNCFDPTLPSSISPKVIGYLRNTMHFNGVIITDSLSMAGVWGYAGNNEGQTAVQAVLAGNDMLCTTYYAEEFNAIYNAIQNGTISEERIDESVERILMMKLRRGIISI